MPPRVTVPNRRRCECGAPLQWESRQSVSHDRWLGLCVDAECGRWITERSDGLAPADPLADFLLGNQPPARYVAPWVRFFRRFAILGWSLHPFPCASCHRPLTFALSIPRHALQLGDPFHAMVCLDCGQTVINLWALGEMGELHLGAEGWINPAVAITALKRTLEACVEAQPESDETE